MTAKAGNLLAARRILREAADAGSRFPSVHWNLACAIPPEEMKGRLDALATGLDCAPSVRILRAAVFLGLTLEDDRSAGWLGRLTFLEALLLDYYHRYDQMAWLQKDEALEQLSHYIERGEPSYPAENDRVTFREMLNLITTLLERKQPAAAEFWFRSREATNRRRNEYWQAFSEFYEKIKRRSDAAQAFSEELACRLRFIARTDSKASQNREDAIINTHRRLNHWLTQCMTPSLSRIGFEIYARAKAFALSTPLISSPPLRASGPTTNLDRTLKTGWSALAVQRKARCTVSRILWRSMLTWRVFRKRLSNVAGETLPIFCEDC